MQGRPKTSDTSEKNETPTAEVGSGVDPPLEDIGILDVLERGINPVTHFPNIPNMHDALDTLDTRDILSSCFQ